MPRLEVLEGRLAPAVVNWSGAVDSSWSNPGNWQGNAVPTANDIATFDGTVSVSSATVDTAFSIAGLNILNNYTGNITDAASLTIGANGFTKASVASAFNVTNSATITNAGNWFVSGSFSAGTGTVIFNGTTTQTILSVPGTPVSFDFNNLTINNGAGGRVVVSANLQPSTFITVGGNFLLSSGSFSMANGFSVLNLEGDFTNNAGPSAFVPGSGQVNFGDVNGHRAASTVGGSSSTTFNTFFLVNASVALASNITVKTFLLGNSLPCDFNNGSSTLTVTGDFTAAAGSTFIPGTGTVAFASGTAQSLTVQSSTQDPGQLTVNNLTVNETPGGGVVLGVNSNLTVAGSFVVQAGSFAAGANTLTADGAFTIASGATFIPQTSTVVFAGSTAQAVQASATTSFNNLTVNNAPGGSVTLAPTASLDVAGDFLLQAGSFADNAITLTIDGNFTNNASTTAFQPGTGTVVFGGAGTQTLGGTAGTTFNHLAITKNAGTSVQLGASANPTVNGNLLLTAGSLASGAATLTLKGDFTNNASATAFGAGTGTVVVAGTGAQTIGGSANTTFNNVTINSAGPSVTLAVSPTLSGTFTLTAGAVVLGAHTLTVKGDFFNNASATAFNGTGGSVVFAGSNPQRLGGSAPTTFGQLGASGTLRLETTQITADSVDVASAATIDLNGTNLATARVTSGGTITQTAGQGRLLLTVQVDTSMTATLAGTVGLTKSGAGKLIYLGTGTTTGTTLVAQGILLINGALAASSATAADGAILGGNGTVNTIALVRGGHLSPGNGAGKLVANGGMTFDAPSSFDVDFIPQTARGPDAFIAGIDYDQVQVVAGAIALNGARLHFFPNSAPHLGDHFTIVSNPNNLLITGTFDALPEGAALTAGGLPYQISYAGGTGHEIVLTGGVRASLALTTSAASVGVGQALTLTATFTVTASGAGVPTGAVKFFDGTTLLGQGTLDAGGRATFTTAALAAGSHSLGAAYSSDGAFLDATTAAVTVTVLGPSNVNPPANLVALAKEMAHSTEYFRFFLTQAFNSYVNRAPNEGEYAFFLSNITGGAHFTDEHIEALFIGAPEYYVKKGGTDAKWLTSMYKDLLFRDPRADELAFWTGRLAQIRAQHTGEAGFNERVQASEEFDTRDEREGQRVQANYLAYLGRKANAAEVAFWVDQFKHHDQTSEDLAGGFVGSFEYFNSGAKSHGDKSAWVRVAYLDLLHRAAQTSEVNFWLGRMS